MKDSTRARLAEAFDDLTGDPHPSLASNVIVGLRRHVSEAEPRVTRAERWVAVATATLLVLALVVGIVIWSHRSLSTPIPSTHNQSPLGTALPQPRIVLTLSETPTQIAYDPDRNVIWLATTTTGGPDHLNRVDASTGAVTTFRLPVADFAGPDSQVKVDGAGNVWMSDGYTLMRLAVGSKHVASITLPVKDPDALGGALTPNSASPGTWITAIGIVGDGLLVARQNVGALVRFDSSLKPVARFRIPTDFAGSTDIYVDQNDRIELLGGVSLGKTLGLFTGDGHLIQKVNVFGMRLATAPGKMIVSGGLDNGAIVTSSAAGLTADTTLTIGTIGSLAAPDPAGGTVLYDGLAGVIERASNGAAIASYRLPKARICPPQPPQPNGRTSCFLVASQITALTVDMRGDIWFTVSSSKELQEIAAP